MSSNGKFNKAKNSLCLQAKRVVFAIKRILTKLKSPPIQVSLHLFNTIAKPLFCYGCEIWGFQNDYEIERVELNYMKYILHLPENFAVGGEIGQFPIHLFWIGSILKYWCRANTGYLQQSFIVQKEMLENGKDCWLARVYQLYITTGLPIKFNTSGSENSKAHVNKIMKSPYTSSIQLPNYFFVMDVRFGDFRMTMK